MSGHVHQNDVYFCGFNMSESKTAPILVQ